METSIYYIVKVKLIKQNNNQEFDFIEYETKFKNRNPIIARENAFSRYQSYLEVIFNKNNISDLEARLKFKSYFVQDNETIKLDEFESIDFTDSFGNGIGVFMKMNTPVENFDITNINYESILSKIPVSGSEVCIHGIGDISFRSNDPNSIFYHLEQEYEAYRHFGYETSSKVESVSFCDRDEWEEGYLGNGKWIDDSYNEPHESKIIKTPFDWSRFDKPYWWGNSNNDETNNHNLTSLEKVTEIINSGESNQVEFKPALLYNFSTRRPGIGIKGIIAKAISAFLNSNGGFLLIGVSDDGQIQGLEHDFKLSKEKNPKDFFFLEFDQMLEHFLSFSVKSNIIGEFVSIQDKEIFLVSVTPLKQKPVFLNGQFKKEFYIRGEASSRQLSDIEDIVNYWIERFK